MVDPSNITNYNLNDWQLEEHALFWIAVAGKTANVTARCLDNLLADLKKWFSPKFSPFELIRKADKFGIDLPEWVCNSGIGCYNLKAKSFVELVNSGLNLRTCTAEDLESIYGIGPKTARCFILHSRKGARYAGLDTHLLKYMRDEMGVENVPKSTPSSKKEYKRLEELFVKHADELWKTPADLDLKIWNRYSK